MPSNENASFPYPSSPLLASYKVDVSGIDGTGLILIGINRENLVGLEHSDRTIWTWEDLYNAIVFPREGISISEWKRYISFLEDSLCELTADTNMLSAEEQKTLSDPLFAHLINTIKKQPSPPLKKAIDIFMTSDHPVALAILSHLYPSLLFCHEEDEYTRFHTLCRRQPHLIRPLLQAGARVDIIDSNGKNLLQYAAYNKALFKNDIELVAEFKERGVDLDAVDNRGWTALHLATMHGNLPMARQLLREGAKVDIMDDQERSALLIASSLGELDIVRLLVQHGVYLHQQDSSNNTPLSLTYDTKIQRYLLLQGGALSLNKSIDVTGVDATYLFVPKEKLALLHNLSNPEKAITNLKDLTKHLLCPPKDVSYSIWRGWLRTLEEGIKNTRFTDNESLKIPLIFLELKEIDNAISLLQLGVKSPTVPNDVLGKIVDRMFPGNEVIRHYFFYSAPAKRSWPNFIAQMAEALELQSTYPGFFPEETAEIAQIQEIDVTEIEAAQHVVQLGIPPSPDRPEPWREREKWHALVTSGGHTPVRVAPSKKVLPALPKNDPIHTFDIIERNRVSAGFCATDKDSLRKAIDQSFVEYYQSVAKDKNFQEAWVQRMQETSPSTLGKT